MAVYSGVQSITETIGASTVDTVILTAPTLTGVTVVNLSGSASMFFTVCPVGGPNVQPTVNGTNCYSLPASLGSLKVPVITTNGVVVNLISSGTPQYSVAIL